MNRCPESERIEAWLDQELAPEAARDLERHLSGCRACAAESRALASLFASLRRVSVRDPGPALTERILDRVVPSRVRRHQVTLIGWCYGAVSAVTTFAFISWAVRPETHVWLGHLVSAAYARLVDAGLLALNLALAVAAQLQRGWGLLEVVGGWVIPVARALGAVATDPLVSTALWGALVCTGALLWWIRPRPVRVVKGDRHVGLLAF